MSGRVLGIVVALFLLAAPLAAGTSRGSSIPEFVDGHVLVGFKPGTTDSGRRAALASADAVEARDLGSGARLVTVAGGKVLEKVDQLRKRSEVAYAEPDYVVHALVTPNDPSLGQLWGLNNTGQTVTGIGAGTADADIDAPEAWNLTTGSSSVVVGVVDTGVDFKHPDLKANIWTNPGGVGGCPAGTRGYDAFGNDCNPMDANNHGTHVSGTIGAVGNNGVGVAGVNWNVKIMGLRFLNANGSGSTSDAIEAINWAVTAKLAGVNIRVLSNSWGGGGFSTPLLNAINNAGANDILFVAAAGNASANNDVSNFYPCNYNSAYVICVAATDSNDALASFSNYGATNVDLAAPGVQILSTIRNGGYAYFNGTSMATPHVSGAAALVLSQTNMTVSALRTRLLSAVDPLGSLSGKVATGGRLNVCKALTGCP